MYQWGKVSLVFSPSLVIAPQALHFSLFCYICWCPSWSFFTRLETPTCSLIRFLQRGNSSDHLGTANFLEIFVGYPSFKRKNKAGCLTLNSYIFLRFLLHALSPPLQLGLANQHSFYCVLLESISSA